MCLRTDSIKVLETEEHDLGAAAGPGIRVVLIATRPRHVQCQHRSSNSTVPLLVAATHLAHVLASLLESQRAQCVWTHRTII